MKSYTAIFERNNGYKCSCCRQTWNDIQSSEFDDNTAFADVLSYFKAFEDEEYELLCLTQDGDLNSYNREGS